MADTRDLGLLNDWIVNRMPFHEIQGKSGNTGTFDSFIVNRIYFLTYVKNSYVYIQLAFGESAPELDETPVSWATWSDGAGGAPTIIGDANWGKLQLLVGEEGRSAVYDNGDSYGRVYILSENRYGTGSGTATLQIRGDETVPFLQDAGEPPDWEDYIGPVTESWRYFQVRVIKSA